MGIYDRDYYRGADDGPNYAPRPKYAPRSHGSSRPFWSSVVNQLVIINIALYVVGHFFAGTELMVNMAVTPAALTDPLQWWRFLTAGFAHDPLNFKHLLFNMFGLWMFGREVEGVLGRWEFLRFYLVALVLGNVAWAAREFLSVGASNTVFLLGASGAVTAVIMLFALNFPKRTVLLFFFIPMPAWVLGVLVVLMNVFGAHSSTALPGDVSRVAYDVHLVGAAFGFMYHQLGVNFGRLVTGGISFRSFLPKPRVRIHDPGGEGRYHDLDEKADRVLDKLHREGEGSLTAKERRVLEDYSRRMRQRRQ
jgi:membrane associated rhomboid family serine protease